jgi:hypothetical protein
MAGSSAASRLARRARGRCHGGACLSTSGRDRCVGFKGVVLRRVAAAAPGLRRVARCVVSRGVSRLRVGCSVGRERGGERVGGGSGCPGGRGRPARVRGAR